MENLSLEAVLAKAIQREAEAYDFYTALAGRIEDRQAKDTLLFLAGEEKKHREFLEAYRRGEKKFSALAMTEVIDYQVAQYLDKPDPEKNLNSAEVYLVAAHREWNSHNFYKDLAQLQPDGEVKDMLLEMAAQELRHKEKVEYLYSNTAFPQTDGG